MIIAVVVLVLLAGGAYAVWATGVWQQFMPAAPQEEQNPTADLEAELQGVELEPDPEVESLEAQF
jgi:hypothetical protein